MSYDIGERLAQELREISVAEFFEKNRHLLGFDSKRKALLTVVKEAVDNSLDACEMAGILPEVIVKIQQLGKDRYRVTVEDNGPGIPPEKVPYVFGKLLYGSKFHKFKQTRGQQGIGISAAVLYGQLTTGEPTTIISKTPNGDAWRFRIYIDIKRNEPEVVEKKKIKWHRKHGTSVTIELEGQYFVGRGSVLEYLQGTAIANPHALIVFFAPTGDTYIFKRKVNKLPKLPEEIKPHPHGIELGMFYRLVETTKHRTLLKFLKDTFYGVGDKAAYFVVYRAFINRNAKYDSFSIDKLSESTLEKIREILEKDPKEFSKKDLQKIWKALQEAELRRPSAKCLSPIGEENLVQALKEMFEPEFVTAVQRKPAVYRGIPFIVEAAAAYGGKIKEFKLWRFANKVPLLFQQGACLITKVVQEIDWRRYHLNQPSGEGFPKDPLVLVVHIASVWVPYVSESKMAIAHYPELEREIKNALHEIGRRLKAFLEKKFKQEETISKYSRFVIYSIELSRALAEVLGKSEEEIKKDILESVVERALSELVSEVASALKKKVDNSKDIAKKIIDSYGIDNIAELVAKKQIEDIRRIVVKFL